MKEDDEIIFLFTHKIFIHKLLFFRYTPNLRTNILGWMLEIPISDYFFLYTE